MKEDNYYSSYTAETSQTNGYVRKKPEYDKDLLWSNRQKYLGHKRSVGYLYTSDVVLGLIIASIVKGSLSGFENNSVGAFSFLLIVGLLAASVIKVTCLENKKVITISMIIFAVCGVIFSLLFGSLLYLIFFYFYSS